MVKEIVDLPMKNGDFPVRKLLIYQRVALQTYLEFIAPCCFDPGGFKLHDVKTGTNGGATSNRSNVICHMIMSTLD